MCLIISAYNTRELVKATIYTIKYQSRPFSTLIHSPSHPQADPTQQPGSPAGLTPGGTEETVDSTLCASSLAHSPQHPPMVVRWCPTELVEDVGQRIVTESTKEPSEDIVGSVRDYVSLGRDGQDPRTDHVATDTSLRGKPMGAESCSGDAVLQRR